jgi:hypothetical protein
MSRISKRLVVAIVAVILYAVAVTVFWAARPLTDAVPVGIDYSPLLLTPPEPQRLISQDVECNTLFAGSARPDEPLPVLAVQPADRPPLEFQREPCELVHRDAQLLFGLNVVAVIVALGGLGWALRRVRRTDDEAPAARAETVGSGAMA